MIGMRNIIAHQYFRIDLETVWEVTQESLPLLREQIEALRESLDNNPTLLK